jgi:hypothetical protein
MTTDEQRDDEEPAEQAAEQRAGEQPAPRRRPEQTTDDTDLGWGEAKDPDDVRDGHERWLREQRPPHWG